MGERAERFFERYAWIGPVQQQEINDSQTQLVQALFRGALKIVWRKMSSPDLGGHEDSSRLIPEARNASPTSRSFS